MPVCACLDVSSMADRCLALSPVFLVDSKSRGASQGGLIIVQGPIMTMTCNLSFSTERPAGHKQTVEIRLTLAEIPSLKRGLIKTCDEGEQFVLEPWLNQSCDQLVVPSGISLSNCRAHVNTFAHAHLVVCVGFFFLFLATFGHNWWHWAAQAVLHTTVPTQNLNN